MKAIRPSPIAVSAAVLILLAIVAVQFRGEILGRVSDIHTGSVGQSLIGRTDRPQSSLVSNSTLPVTVPESQPPVTLEMAQGAPSTRSSGRNTPASQPQEPQQVDESALRYFAAQGDNARLQAEIARLRSLYPNWTPPANPLAVPENVDSQLDSMWQLYASSRYAEVRKAIVDRQQSEPGWQPPANLLEMLDLAEARQRLTNASDLKQYATVIQTAAANPGLLTCSEIDVLWRVAEAFARSERPERARDAYLYVLQNCTQTPERIATVQKAAALLPQTMMEELLSLEKVTDSGAMEFEPVKDDLARQFVANAGEDPEIVVPPVYLMRLQRVAETSGLAADDLLLGWYYVRREKLDEAEKWFRHARDAEDTASASQGLALALIARNEPKEAEDIMFRWRTSSEDARKTYLAAAANLLAIDPAIPLPADVLQRIGAESVSAKDAATAQQFGWYSRAFQQPQLALQWFAAALGWEPEDEPSAYGLALTQQELNNTAETRRIQQQWAGRSQRIADVGRPEGQTSAPVLAVNEPAAPNVTAYQPPSGVAPRQARIAPISQQPRFTQRPAMERRSASASNAACSTGSASRQLASQSALQNGWCLMEANRPAEALASFEAALRSDIAKVRSDAAYGQSLAYLRLGLTDNAAVSASKSGLDKSRATELQVSILSDRAISAYQNGRYAEALLLLDQRTQFATERSDLMVIRGYAYLNMKRYADAIRIFESVAATGNRDAIRGLANALTARPGFKDGGG